MAGDLSKLELQISYDSGENDLLQDFYIPVLSNATSYDRIAGFFSSTSLAIAARGIAGLIQNGGKMRLVTCPQLSKEDAETMSNFVKAESILADNFISDYNQIEEEFQRNHIKALGWMLANGKLEIKIAFLKKGNHYLSKDEIDDSGIMHQKVGIFRDDEGNFLSFSGSNNESSSGWLTNSEEFKVFTSWTGCSPFIEADLKKFSSFWSGTRKDCVVIDLPKAVHEQLLTISSDFKLESVITSRYIARQKNQKPELKLFHYQEEAVQKWNENDRKLLLQMATGTGKTRTAIGCIAKALKDTPKLLVVVATPQPTLSAQWKKDIESLNTGISNSIEINGTVADWGKLLQTSILRLSAGYTSHLVVFTTHNLAHTDQFLKILGSMSRKVTAFLVGDEVHGMGAEKMQEGLSEIYRYRLGLSATPQRWFDESGTEKLEQYFGNASFEFGIEEALREHNPLTGKTFLVDYYYFPRFIHMTDDELEKYDKLTKKIMQMSSMNDKEKYRILDYMRFQRADIEKTAKNKYPELETILNEIQKREGVIEDTIIFVSPEQIPHVLEMLGKRKIFASPFTEKQSFQERERIIAQFKQQEYQVLVAIKCLDEGIDIPSAKRAIIMASSTNPREYVQRIGRVIRQAPGKTNAEIYDLILQPNFKAFHNDRQVEMEKRIFKKEMDRAIDLSRNALDNISVTNRLYEILRGIL